MPNIEYINENLVKANSKWFSLSLYNDEIVFWEIVKNPDIAVYNVVVNKDGFIFVQNNIITCIRRRDFKPSAVEI
jgi:hypothetical protein